MFHNNVTLTSAWPLLLVRRPWVVAHHTWIPRDAGLGRLKGHVKQRVLRRAECISISRAVANHMDTPSTIVPNPYDSALFRRIEGVARKRDIVFVGRLVSDKGADVLLRAIHTLKRDHGIAADLTVVGEGPERDALAGLARNLEIDGLITFTGTLTGETLAREMNAHTVMVIPSQWSEPFGIVALEGIACGCAAVATSGGGLPDAVGPCGVTFPRGDSATLARILAELLSDQRSLDRLTGNAADHLEKHHIEKVAASYLEIMEKALKSHRCR